MKKYFFVVLCFVFAAGVANAAVHVGAKAVAAAGGGGKGAVATNSSTIDGDFDDFDMTGMDESVVIAQLEADIAETKALYEECEKQRKGWITATAVGSAGVVATGVGMIVQGKKMKEKGAELDEASPDWRDSREKLFNRLINKAKGN